MAKVAGWLIGSIAAILFAVAVGIVTVDAVEQAKARGVTIDPIGVPASLVEMGQDRHAVAAALEARIRALQNAANSERLRRPFNAKPLDLDVPKSTITARFIIEPLLRLVGLPIVHVGGTISKASDGRPEQFQFDLSETSGRQELFFSETGALPSLLQRGAIAILSRYDVYAATAALISTGGKGAPVELLAKFRAEAAASRNGEDLPWAELLDGYDLQARGAWAAAAERFRAAGERYGRLYPDLQSWPLAIDGEAYSLMEAGQDKAAAELLDKLLSTQPKVVSALYHHGILAQKAGQTCAALEFLERATAADPRYSLAWQELGTLYVARFDALLRNADTAGPGSDCMSGDRSAVSTKAREFLRTAVGGNEFAGPAWYQLGVLDYLAGSFEEAARHFTRATGLNASDAHSWHSLGDSLLGQAETTGEPAAAARAIPAYCRARELRPQERWHDDQLAKAARITGVPVATVCRSGSEASSVRP